MIRDLLTGLAFVLLATSTALAQGAATGAAGQGPILLAGSGYSHEESGSTDRGAAHARAGEKGCGCARKWQDTCTCEGASEPVCDCSHPGATAAHQPEPAASTAKPAPGEGAAGQGAAGATANVTSTALTEGAYRRMIDTVKERPSVDLDSVRPKLSPTLTQFMEKIQELRRRREAASGHE